MKNLIFLKLRIVHLTLLLFYSFSISYAGEKQLYLFGGGGEPERDWTIFDEGLRTLSQFTNAKESKWKANQSFNGGHKTTEKILSSKLSKARSLGRFNESNLPSVMSGLEAKLNSMNKGDQLLLIMATHGAINLPDEKSHSVSLSSTEAVDLKTLNGSKKVSMDEFEKIFALASSKGVKLALLDLSCFSGNTLKISNKDACVISASGEKQYSYAYVRDPGDKSTDNTFGGRLLERMKIGSNLEDIFLEARAGSGYQDFPMISTDTGFLLNDLIYKMITPYLLYNDKSIAEFSGSYDVENMQQSLCKTENQYSEIKKRIEEISNLASIPKKLINTAKLEKALDSYRKFQLAYENGLSEAQRVGNEVKEIILSDYPDKAKLFEKEDGVSILFAEYESTSQYFKEEIAKKSNEWIKNSYQNVYNDLLVKSAIQKDVTKKLSAKSKANIKNFQNLYEYSQKTKQLAENVATEAKNLYDTLYRASSKKSSESNPCKDFVL